MKNTKMIKNFIMILIICSLFLTIAFAIQYHNDIEYAIWEPGVAFDAVGWIDWDGQFTQYGHGLWGDWNFEGHTDVGASPLNTAEISITSIVFIEGEQTLLFQEQDMQQTGVTKFVSKKDFWFQSIDFYGTHRVYAGDVMEGLSYTNMTYPKSRFASNNLKVKSIEYEKFSRYLDKDISKYYKVSYVEIMRHLSKVNTVEEVAVIGKFFNLDEIIRVLENDIFKVSIVSGDKAPLLMFSKDGSDVFVFSQNPKGEDIIVKIQKKNNIKGEFKVNVIK